MKPRRTGGAARRIALAWCAVGLLVLRAHALTLATFNVENYTLADRMVDGVYRKAYPKPEAEKAAIVTVIKGIAPDILAVQEMGPQPYLDEFQGELRSAGLDYPYAVLLQAADPDRHVAVLSKLPFKDVRRHADLAHTYFGKPDRVKRGALEVVLSTDAGDVSVFVVHLKSRRTERKDDPESAQQRAREAESVRDRVLERFPDPANARFIVCGDWNDTPGTRPVRALQKRGDTVIGELLRATDSRGEAWTHHYRREDTYSRIDYIMVSPGLKAAAGDGRAKIWDGAGTGEGSDHRPVYVKLALEPAR